jgi:very-short-patch-repair endonuclease
MNNWSKIKEFYESVEHLILDEDQNRYAIDHYSWESLGITMTPIERLMWADIRMIGIVMYPQYPVGGVFVDFANPKAKVAIECDGKDFHDAVKDAARDKMLREIGWRVYRITGSDCVKCGNESYDDENHYVYEKSPGERLALMLKDIHQI